MKMFWNLENAAKANPATSRCQTQFGESSERASYFYFTGRYSSFSETGNSLTSIFINTVVLCVIWTADPFWSEFGNTKFMLSLFDRRTDWFSAGVQKRVERIVRMCICYFIASEITWHPPIPAHIIIGIIPLFCRLLTLWFMAFVRAYVLPPLREAHL